MNAGEDMEKKKEISYTVGDTAIMENSMEIPLKSRNKSIIWPSNPIIGHIPWENHNRKDTCTPMFIGAYLIARTWREPRSPSTDESIKKMCYVYIQWDITQPQKRNTYESVLVKWMNLEPIIQGDVSQKEKNKYSILTHGYMESLKKLILMNLFARNESRCRCREWAEDTVGEGESGMNEESSINVYTLSSVGWTAREKLLRE